MADKRIRDLGQETSPALTGEVAIDGSVYAENEKVTLEDLKDLIALNTVSDYSLITNYQLASNLNAANKKITNLADGSLPQDAVNYSQLAQFSGGTNLIEDYTMLQNLDGGGFKVTGLAEATNANDAIIKDQIDDMDLIENYTLLSNLNCGNRKLTTILRGSAGTDGVNKQQMEEAIAAAALGTTGLTLIYDYELAENLDANYLKIFNLFGGTNDNDAVNYKQLTDAIAQVSGSTGETFDYIMTQDLDANSYKIIGLHSGTTDYEAVNVKQMDNIITDLNLIEDYTLQANLDGNRYKIEDIADATLSGDAVNFGQITDMNLIENYTLLETLNANSQNIRNLNTGVLIGDAVNLGQINSLVLIENYTMSRDLDGNLYKLTNLAQGVLDTDSVTKGQMDETIQELFNTNNPILNYTMTQDLNADNFKLINLVDGVIDTDSVTKGQMDDAIQESVGASTFYSFSKLESPVTVTSDTGSTYQEILTLEPGTITSGVYEYSFNVTWNINQGETAYIRFTLNNGVSWEYFELEPNIRASLRSFNFTFIEDQTIEILHPSIIFEATKNYTLPDDDYTLSIEKLNLIIERKSDFNIDVFRMVVTSTAVPTFTGVGGNLIVTSLGGDLYDVTSDTETLTSFVCNANKTSITDVIFLGSGILKSFNSAFYQCTNLTTLNLYGVKFDLITDMSYMCYECSSLESFPLVDTSNITAAVLAFRDCHSLTSAPIYDFNSCDGIGMRSIFTRCYSLTSHPGLHVSSNCTSLTSIYATCTGLTSVGEFTGTGNVTNFSSMFWGTKLSNVPHIDTSSGNEFYHMFQDCEDLVCLTNLDTTNQTSTTNLFTNTPLLTSPNASEQAALLTGSNYVNPSECG